MALTPEETKIRDAARKKFKYANNPEYRAKRARAEAERYQKNRDNILKQHAEYRSTIEHREQRREYDKEYFNKNKSRIAARRKEKRRRCSQTRLSENLRWRLNCAIRNDTKSGSAVNDLGCSIRFLKDYLEYLFQPGMTWDNWGTGPGTWQIDHIKPLCSVDLTDRNQFLEVVHYTNLQPIWDEDHKIKSAKDIRC